jgi:mannose-6-phosphate isomerase
VGLGLKPGTTRHDFERAIQEVRAEELLNWIDVRKGEMIYVDAGTVHAIGPGSVMVETQQNSDTTYRLYDYGRPRELHLRDGLEALKEKTHAGKVSAPASTGQWTELVCSPCFRVDKASLKKGQSLESQSNASAAQIVVATEGSGVIESKGAPPIAFRKGEVVVVPATVREYSVRGQWSVEVLRAMVPGPDACEPETTLQ